MKFFYYISSVFFLSLSIYLTVENYFYAWLLFLAIAYVSTGIHDLFFSKSTILRLYPVFGHLRFLSEEIRPMIQQYFVTDNQNERPFNREIRSLVYQRAKNVVDTLPFGTQREILEQGYEFACHSLVPQKVPFSLSRIVIGSSACQQPYDCSRFNVSAMSYGALSANAILALNQGAKHGNFAHNTGEGGISDYHLVGGDLIWQIGTGYFGCRSVNGGFDAEKFQKRAAYPQVKMIEIKLSQGAKPSHGGILPGKKVTQEIAQIRDIKIGETCISPPAHQEFNTPVELLHFVKKLRELSGGKPIGFKLCIGVRREFLAICKAILETDIVPDFIAIDGAEGGTGAAPVEFSNRLGLSIGEAIPFVHSCLVGINKREEIKLIASGKVATGFDLVRKIALGADICCAARTMMFALGCIQSLRCNTNKCPTGVATQDPNRTKGIDVKDKALRVYNYHQLTLKSFLELLGAMGVSDPGLLKPCHVHRRLSATESKAFSEIYDYLESGELLNEDYQGSYAIDWQRANSNSFLLN